MTNKGCYSYNWEVAILIAVILLLLFFWFYKFLFISTPSEPVNTFTLNMTSESTT